MQEAQIIAVGRADLQPYPISARLRSQLVYFMSPSDQEGVPPLGEDEYWFARRDVTDWLMEGVIYLVSPLDTANMTEVELTEEQEALLSWLDRNQVEHVRVVD
jgi:hypothetical protein